MARNKNVDRALERARQVRARLTPVTSRVKPLAGKTGAATRSRLRKTRTWAAPQVKRAGEVLQDSVAPKVSALMSAAAERIDPDQPRHGRGSRPAGATRLRSAATAAGTRLRKRARRGPAAPADTAADAGVEDATQDGQPKASDAADEEASSQVSA